MSSIWDDPEMADLVPPGIVIDYDTAQEILAEEPPISAGIPWVVLERWCRDHPGSIRILKGLYHQVTTFVRKEYPSLTVRATRRRRVEGRELVDLLVCHVPEGGFNPFHDPVPGVELKPEKR